MGFPGGASDKEPACQCRRCKRCRFDPWIRKISWRRAWQPTLVFLPGEPHGPRGLVGYSPWDHRESDVTRWPTHTHTHEFTTVSNHLSCIHAELLQSCLTLCHPVDHSLRDSSDHGILQARILESVCQSLFQGILPTQGSNPGLPHCRQILYCLSHLGNYFC